MGSDDGDQDDRQSALVVGRASDDHDRPSPGRPAAYGQAQLRQVQPAAFDHHRSSTAAIRRWPLTTASAEVSLMTWSCAIAASICRVTDGAYSSSEPGETRSLLVYRRRQFLVRMRGARVASRSITNGLSPLARGSSASCSAISTPRSSPCDSTCSLCCSGEPRNVIP